jgi:aryl-phospho-beta-D-glucosidase BglC (GH1 family)
MASESHESCLRLSRRQFLALLSASGAATLLAACAPTSTPTPPPPTATPSPSRTPLPTPLETPPTPTPKTLGPYPPATYARLPRWRGFNLLEKFTLAGNQPYQEWDFDFMVEWGFNFIRLPTDYRIWTPSAGDYRERPLQEIDQAVAWARARGIHVNLCLHRAPGYCVNPPRERLDLWADGDDGEEARRQFAGQWRMFAARYKGIPAGELSFNLLNEPPGEIDAATYLRAVEVAVTAIRAEDPERLSLADGLSYATQPVPELAPLQIAQSMHMYEPFALTHYRADWVEGSSEWPVPTWPIMSSINAFLYGDEKPEFQAPFILQGDFAAAAQLTIWVDEVSHQANLLIKADGSVVYEKWFEPGPGEGEWKESTFREEWDIYQAVYDRPYVADIPAGTREIQIELTIGDWITFKEMRIQPYAGAPDGRVVLKAEDHEWAVPQQTYMLDAQGNLSSAGERPLYSKATLWADYVQPWVALMDTGTGAHVGEWGAYSYTPHAVVLAWMRDCLDNWEQAGMGWALWSLRGGFGPLDSERGDVEYEDYQGHQLDREMLELLRES